MVTRKAILIFVLFFDIELCDWHFANWQNEDLYDRRLSQIQINKNDGYRPAMMYCNTPRRMDS